jgi:hypothetical protein
MEKIPEKILSRKLDPREKRRLQLYNTLPEDAVLEHASNLPMLVYKYGCCLDTSLEQNGRQTLVMDYKRTFAMTIVEKFVSKLFAYVERKAHSDCVQQFPTIGSGID